VNSLSLAYPHLSTPCRHYLSFICLKSIPVAFIATGMPNNPSLTPNPKSWDVHVYQTPGKRYFDTSCLFCTLTMRERYRVVCAKYILLRRFPSLYRSRTYHYVLTLHCFSVMGQSTLKESMQLYRRTPIIYSVHRPREDLHSPPCRVCLVHMSGPIACS
jgi:hypothetical protein